MRSSETETHPTMDVKTRSSSRVPRAHSRTPYPQDPAPQTRNWKRHFVLVPSEGWSPLVLLAIAVFTVVYSLTGLYGMNGQSHILYLSAAAGLGLGFGVAKNQGIPQALLHLGACLIGHWLSIWLTSAVAFHVSWLLLLANLRSVITMSPVTNIRQSGDMLFLFYLSFLSFFLGYFGAWLVYRAHLPWLVAFFYCSIMLATLSFTVDEGLPLPLIILLGALLLLIARIYITTQITTWTSQGLHTNRSWFKQISGRFMQIATIFVLIALLLTWVLPVQAERATFWDQINNVWSHITNGQFPFQNPAEFIQPSQAPVNFFSDQLTIAADVNLPSGEVLYYTGTRYQPQYLEGFTYDNFNGHTWSSTIMDSQNVAANVGLPVNGQGNYNQVNVSVTMLRPPDGSKHYIFAPDQPERFDVATTVYVGNDTTTMPTAWAKQTAFSPGEQYQVQSLVPTLSPQDLASIPPLADLQNPWQNDANYWFLHSYYLLLPTELSPLVQETAQQWTAGAPNAYAAMKLLESHLSDTTQFSYSLSNPPVPDSVDAVSWLLQTRQGFCTYYATAMAIMARLLGMPARIVNGFSQGTYDVQHNRWVVKGSDAHSWVQVYFPNIGWINFDPTPGYSLDGKQTPPAPPTPPAQPHPTPQTGTNSSAHTTLSNGADHLTLLIGLSLGALFCSLLLLLLAILTYWWRNLYKNASLVAGMYWRVCKLISWAGLPPQKWQTPYEFSQALGRYLPDEMAPMRRLTELFVRDRWAALHNTSTVEEDELERLWPHFRRLFVRLLLLRMKK